MKRNIAYIFLLLAAIPLFSACTEDEVEDPEYADWQNRNSAYFQEQISTARAAIVASKEAYGEAWEEHCPWRLFRTYTLPEGAPAATTDSIAVRIVERGSGSGSPLYTDSVHVNYIGRLIPTENYPQGKIFDHSGRTNRPEDVFSSLFARPVSMYVGNTVEGFCTAVMHMHIGDRWQVFIPQEMGYGTSNLSSIPGGSTLVFDLQLKSYTHAGATGLRQ